MGARDLWDTTPVVGCVSDEESIRHWRVRLTIVTARRFTGRSRDSARRGAHNVDAGRRLSWLTSELPWVLAEERVVRLELLHLALGELLVQGLRPVLVQRLGLVRLVLAWRRARLQLVAEVEALERGRPWHQRRAPREAACRHSRCSRGSGECRQWSSRPAKLPRCRYRRRCEAALRCSWNHAVAWQFSPGIVSISAAGLR
jgi:hypothetical protein